MQNRAFPSLLGTALLWLLLTPAWAEPETPSSPPVLVGGSVDALYGVSVIDVEIVFSLIFNEMLSDIDERFEVKVYDSNRIVEEKYRAGEVQVVFIDAASFLPLEPFTHPRARYAVQRGASLKQPYLLLVRKDSEVSALTDLRDGKLAAPTGHQMGQRFLDLQLIQQGQPVSEDFFREIRILKDVNSAIIELYFGNVDAALIPHYGFQLAADLNPQVAQVLRVMLQSEPLLYQVIGLRFDFPEERIAPIESRILANEPPKRLQHIFEAFNVTRFHRLDEETVKETRALNERYRALIRNLH